MPNASPEESIFIAALEFRDESARASYLANACGADQPLRQRVEHLLAAYPEGEFLEAPVSDLAATALLPPLGEQPGDTIGHYKLLEQIGEGGMGLVFMADQSQPLRRRVALKIIKPGLDTRAVIARFEAERQALALMDHPNIARVFDAGATDSGRPYFVMELVRGAPITEYCREQELPLRERLELFIEVCHAVQHAHQKGVIHRDLKPTNILVAQSDTAPIPKVIDFGVAKAIAQPLTERTLFTGFAQIIGTPLYMSPEQADWGNQDIDTRSDVYSLGVILYELLTGATPFDADRLRGASHDEMRRILREEEPPRPSTRATTAAMATTKATAHPPFQSPVNVADLQGDLDWIVMKALDKDRRRRYESPSAIAEDVRRYLANEVVEARGPSRSYQIQKFAQRHRAALALLTGLAAILIVMSVVGVSLAVRATRAEGLANARLHQVSSERNEKEAARVRAVAGERSAERARKMAEASRAAAEEARTAAEWNLYSSRMFHASRAWNDSDYSTLQSLIGRTQAAAGGSDFRGWEWYFLDRRLDEAFLALPPGPVWHAAWHPRRNELAVVVPRSDHGAAVELWVPGRQVPVKTLALILRNTSGPQLIHSEPLLAWSGDGGLLAYSYSLSEESSTKQTSWVVVVDVATGNEAFRRQAFAEGEWSTGSVRALALTPQGDAVAVGNHRGQVKLWNVDSGELRLLADPPEDANHTSLAFSPEGDRLAGAFRWGARRVWNLKTGADFDHQPIGDSSQGMVRWSPNGRRLAASDSNAGVAIYDVDVRAPARTLPSRGAMSISWLDNDHLLVGGIDKWIRTYNANDGTEVDSLRVTDQLAVTLEVNHDGTLLLTDGVDNVSVKRVVDLNRAAPFPAVVKARRDGVASDHLVQWSRDGRRLASAWVIRMGPEIRDYADLRVIDRATNQDQDAANREIGIVRSLAWAQQDEAALLAFTYHGRFHEFAIGASADDRMKDLPKTIDSHGPSDFAPDGGELLHSDGENVVIRDTDSLETRRQFSMGGPMRQIRMSPNAQRFFVGSYDWWRFVDANTGELTEVERNGNQAAWVESVAWSPDSKRLAAGVSGGAIELWEADPPAILTRLTGHDGPVIGLDWSSDGRRIASGAEEGAVRVWDAVTGDPVAAFPLPAGVVPCSVQWSPNCRELAAGASNGDVYFFDAGPSFPGPDLPPSPTSVGTKSDENSPSP